MEAIRERRRGSALEDAILDAAWAELSEQGYAAMTLEAVARRAGTSRPVLHRRWPSRVKLATAALGRYLATNPIQVPDLGSIRAEMSLLLRGLSSRARPDLIRLLFDMSGDLPAAKSRPADLRAEITNARTIRAVIQRGNRPWRGRPRPSHAAHRRAGDRPGASRDADDTQAASRRSYPGDRGRYFPAAGPAGCKPRIIGVALHLPNRCALAGARPRDDEKT